MSINFSFFGVSKFDSEIPEFTTCKLELIIIFNRMMQNKDEIDIDNDVPSLDEKQEISNELLNHPQTLFYVRDRYLRYKRDDAYFYVPMTAFITGDSVTWDIGDKSFTEKDTLKKTVDAWAGNKLQDISPFIDLLWKHKEQDIKVLVLIETEDYCWGYFAVLDENKVI